MHSTQRNLTQIPPIILLGFVLFLPVQIGYHHFYGSQSSAGYQRLKPPAEAGYYRALAFGSDKLISYLRLLGVQLHDNQKGRHINYRHLDYEVLSEWLLTLYDVNPTSDYPAFLASRVYSQVKNPDKISRMIDVVEALFDQNPRQHWRRMTEACLLAKHQLKDLPRALGLAQQISALPQTIKLPFWARDMELVLLDELNELESAQLLISSMLQSGEINDADEIRFLKSRLLKIQQEMSEN